MKTFQYIIAIANFLFGGLSFRRFKYIRKEIQLAEYIPYDGTRLYAICFTLWPQKGFSSKEISSIDIKLKANSLDPKLMDIVVTDTKLGQVKVNHLSSIEKTKVYDLSIDIDYNSTRGKAVVVIEVCHATHYNPQTLHYVMPCDKLGYRF
jgi:hypothetical protein